MNIKINLDNKKERVIRKILKGTTLETELENMITQWVNDRILNHFKNQNNIDEALNILDN